MNRYGTFADAAFTCLTVPFTNHGLDRNNVDERHFCDLCRDRLRAAHDPQYRNAVAIRTLYTHTEWDDLESEHCEEGAGPLEQRLAVLCYENNVANGIIAGGIGVHGAGHRHFGAHMANLPPRGVRRNSDSDSLAAAASNSAAIAAAPSWQQSRAQRTESWQEERATAGPPAAESIGAAAGGAAAIAATITAAVVERQRQVEAAGSGFQIVDVAGEARRRRRWMQTSHWRETRAPPAKIEYDPKFFS